jgi:hypothetical protein
MMFCKAVEWCKQEISSPAWRTKKLVPSAPSVFQYDPEIVALYKEEAEAHGMSVSQYLSQCDFPMADIAYKYWHGNPLVRPEEILNLPTRLRKLHKWYMEASKDGKNWIILGINDEHYFRGTDDINIEFAELFQLYNLDALDKSIISAYCL